MKLTAIEQEAAASNAPGQVFVWEKTKREAGPPVKPMLVIVRLAVPVFVNVICIELTAFICTRPKFSFAGTSLTVPLVTVIATHPVDVEVGQFDLLGSATDVALSATLLD